ncbi:MAG: chorismate mutase [Alphaproteobacteria bacterium]|nr:chorismate mutase [Alphaproteobacteria bacterium]
MSKTLDNARKKIDTLDNKIHDLLMERAELIVGIAEEKRKNNLQFVHPAREAMMIRRLLARHKGALPTAAIVRIWRELVGAISLMQTGLKVVVALEDGSTDEWDMAKNYFGSVVPMQKSSSSLAALALLREDEASFAVLPWPHDGDENPWWTYLSNHENRKIQIVCALPYGVAKGDQLSLEDKALVLSKDSCFSSGEDNSFLILDIDHSASRARIVEAFKELDFNPVAVYTKSGAELGIQSMHMIEVNDYIAEDDERLRKLESKFTDQEAVCRVVGAYPVPPVYQKSEAEINAQITPLRVQTSKTGI